MSVVFSKHANLTRKKSAGQLETIQIGTRERAMQIGVGMQIGAQQVGK